MVGVKIEGLEETLALFDKASRAVKAQGFRRGLQAGINVIGAEVARRTPVNSGELLSNIKVQVTLDSEHRGGVATVGFGKLDYLAAFVEYGHELVGHKPGKKKIGRVAAHPFIRPAAAAVSQAAVDAFTQELTEVITEEYGGS